MISPRTVGLYGWSGGASRTSLVGTYGWIDAGVLPPLLQLVFVFQDFEITRVLNEEFCR